MRISSLFTSVVLAAGLFTAAASAQDYPTKPVNYIIPFNAGGESDVAARLQQPVWEKLTGQPMVIQYVTGAGGAQAWSQLNGMEGDGYTIMGTNLPHIILQPMAQDVGYKTDDIANVYFFQYTPDAIIVPKDSQFKTLKDLVDYAKANPGLVTFSGSGTNSANDVAQTKFDKLAGVTTTYIPFSGTSPATAAVLGSQVLAGFSYTTAAISQGDAVRVLAVAADERVPSFPDVPTFKELGYDMVGGAYRGVAVPKSTPEDVRKAVSDRLDAVNKDPDFIKKMEDGGFVVINVPYADVPKFMAEREKDYQATAKLMGIAQK
ncbi:Bug family tripartite tricarboxylate transporter substrate binding protein [Jiella mangrovi]|uniref:Tripartite tricarboxylate transporter substrate binding protein n=1 Tax=Jiella mangrovi TaxID=2821407 RepID=A0ABS4BNB8_9HYPH|nr:tripartite tricarboxylate transporter substrate binding protein [Jiella mangrovi]MBP0618175.1 tripartite tricarboxylate transporter substrate binding protein [Jiella mangrovi]